MGSPSTMSGCRATCWDTGTVRYHEPGCPNVGEEAQRSTFVPFVAGKKLAPAAGYGSLSVLAGPPRFISDAERHWHNIAAPYAKSPAERVLFALVRGEPVSGRRLVWGYEHAKRGTVEKELLGVRLRRSLGLADDAPLVKAVAHG